MIFFLKFKESGWIYKGVSRFAVRSVVESVVVERRSLPRKKRGAATCSRESVYVLYSRCGVRERQGRRGMVETVGGGAPEPESLARGRCQKGGTGEQETEEGEGVSQGRRAGETHFSKPKTRNNGAQDGAIFIPFRVVQWGVKETRRTPAIHTSQKTSYPGRCTWDPQVGCLGLGSWVVQ